MLPGSVPIDDHDSDILAEPPDLGNADDRDLAEDDEDLDEDNDEE